MKTKKLFLIIFISLVFFPSIKNAEEIELKFYDIKNNFINLNTKNKGAFLLLFFNPLDTNHKSKLAYAQLLHNKYNGDGLEIIGVSNQDKNVTLELHDYGRFSFPFVVNSDKSIIRKFKMDDCCGGTVLLSKGMKIKFQQSQLLNNENLRQLINKEMEGKVVYDIQPNHDLLNRIDLLKETLPTIPLLNCNTDEVSYLSEIKEDLIILTFISSFCAVCKSRVRIRSHIKIEEMIKKNKKSVKLVLAFFRPYSPRDIHNLRQQIPLPFNVYISLEDIFTDEEKYVTDPSLRLDPFTILINENREFVFTEAIGMNEKEVYSILEQSIKGKK